MSILVQFTSCLRGVSPSLTMSTFSHLSGIRRVAYEEDQSPSNSTLTSYTSMGLEECRNITNTKFYRYPLTRKQTECDLKCPMICKYTHHADKCVLQIKMRLANK